MKRIAVVGIGGMGREVLDIIEAMRVHGDSVDIAGVVDDFPTDVNLERLRVRGYTYLGTSEEVLSGDRLDGYVIGVGSPAVRRKIADRFDVAGWTPYAVVHPGSTAGSEVRIEAGAVVCAGVRMTTNILVERHALLNLNVTVGHDTSVGAFCVANPGAHISGDVVIGSEVLIGTGAVVLQGLGVGSNATIGANACVTKDVDAGQTVVGVPARPR